MELKDSKIAILATDGFEQSELFQPLGALREQGAMVDIISDREGKIKAWDRTDWGKSIPVDKKAESAHALDYDALVLPGGVLNPDTLRTDIISLNFIRAFFEREKLVAAICHAPWLLISAGQVKGRRLTSYKSIRTDVENAGGLWEDAPVVVDQGLITSRNPDDLPIFCETLIHKIREEWPGGQKH